MARALSPALLAAAPWALRSVAAMLPPHPPAGLTAFLDANLLISAQAPTSSANALYGSAALDLPRRGVYHIRGGIGALAETLAAWIRASGGVVLYRQPVSEICLRHGRVSTVLTRKGRQFPAHLVVANLTPWSLSALLAENAPPGLGREIRARPASWGAFTLYLGLEATLLPANTPDHHQVVVNPGLPLGEGNSVFLSLSPLEDLRRAPTGMRALTLSTHTDVHPWWHLLEHDPQAYAARKAE